MEGAMKIVAEVEQNFSSSLFPEISENVAMDFSPDASLRNAFINATFYAIAS